MGKMEGMILLLDVDGVLQFAKPGFIQQVEREYAWREGYVAFRDSVFRDPEYAASLEGRGDFLSLARRHLAEHVQGLTAEVFFERWMVENVVFNDELLEAVPHLGARAVYLATNQERLRADRIEQHYSAYPWLAGAFISSRLGVSKPSPNYFERVLGALGCDASDAVFVDDHAPNVAAAQAVGICGIRYENNAQLFAQLRRLQLSAR